MRSPAQKTPLKNLIRFERQLRLSLVPKLGLVNSPLVPWRIVEPGGKMVYDADSVYLSDEAEDSETVSIDLSP